MSDYQVKEIFLSYDKDKSKIANFLATQNLKLDGSLEKYFAVFDEDKIVGSGGFGGCTIKSVAVSCKCQGGSVVEILMSRIIEEMTTQGITDIFIFTKPEAASSFKFFNFTELARTEEAVLLENSSLNINKYVKKLNTLNLGTKNNGAVIVNCNPFTLGHRYLLEKAANAVDHLFVFVVSEDKSSFPTEIRYKLVKDGVVDLDNVTVLTGGNYIISSATFPTYFLKQKSEFTRIQAELDAKIFTTYIAKALSIKTRFVGEEPYCEVTSSYNRALKKILNNDNIELEIIKRKEFSGEAISASRVREVLKNDENEVLKNLVPKVTYDFLTSESSITKEIISKIKNKAGRH